MLTTEQKEKLVSNVRLRLAREFPDINPAQACLQSSFLVLHELYKLNIRGVLQCGNMHWRAVAKEKDDGLRAVAKKLKETRINFR